MIDLYGMVFAILIEDNAILFLINTFMYLIIRGTGRKHISY